MELSSGLATRERKRRESLACRAVIEARASRLAAAKRKSLVAAKEGRPQLPPRGTSSTAPSPARDQDASGPKQGSIPGGDGAALSPSSVGLGIEASTGDETPTRGAAAVERYSVGEAPVPSAGSSDMPEDDSDDESSPVEVRLFIHEAQKLWASDSDGASDPFARATCFGMSKETRVINNDLNPYFDELLTFTGTRAELRSALTLEVYDYDFMVSDDLIGAYVFDLGTVLTRPHKEYYKAWVTLLDTSGQRAGPQGRIQVTLTILEKGDEFPPRPGIEVPANNSDLQPYTLSVSCYTAEGLPFSKAKQFISVRWAGASVETESIPWSVHKDHKHPDYPDGTDRHLTCHFQKTLELPIIREDNSAAPQTSDSVHLRLRKADLTPGKVRTIASSTLSLRDIANDQWISPVWLNLYGCPRKDDPEIAPPPSDIVFGDPQNTDAMKMNEGELSGSCYRGRCLITASLSRQLPGTLSHSFDLLTDQKVQRPATVDFYLDASICVGCDLPANMTAYIRVSWGLDGRASTAAVSTGQGLATWNEQLQVQVAFPFDVFQIPDIFLELIEEKSKRRTHFCRVSIGEFKSGEIFRSVNGWRTWHPDDICAGGKPELYPLELQPRVLMQLHISQHGRHRHGEHAHAHRHIMLPHKLPRDLSERAWRHKRSQAEFGGDFWKPDYAPYLLRAQIHMARNLIVSDTEELSSDPFVRISIADFANDAAVARVTSTVEKSRCPQWLESLEISGLMLPGRSSLDKRLHMAPGINLAVFDDDGDGNEAELMGRLHIPMHVIASTEWPRWLPLDIPGTGIVAGEILVGFELYGPQDAASSAATHDYAPFETTKVDVSTFVVGCRDLLDKRGRFSNKATGQTWAEVALSAGNYRGTTSACEYPTGANPSYLESVVFRGVDMPCETMFAPSLTVSICRNTLMSGRQVIGTTTLDLTHHLDAYLTNQGQGIEIDFAAAVLDDKHRKVRSKADHNSTQPGMLAFRKGTVISLVSVEPDVHSGVAMLSGWIDGQDEIGMFPADIVDTVFEAPQGGDEPPYMQHRSISMDELENLFGLSEFSVLNIKADKEKAGTKVGPPRQSELGRLKLYLVLTDANRNGSVRQSMPLMIGNSMISPPVPVTVRVYVLRAQNLTGMDADHSADPYLQASVDAAFAIDDHDDGVLWPGSRIEGKYRETVPGVWPKGSKSAGKAVEKTVISKSQNPYFGQPFEWTKVLLPGPATLQIDVWDDDGALATDDLIGSTVVNLEDRYFSTQWHSLGSDDDDQRIRKPAEWRDLTRGTSSITQGRVLMWIEVFPSSEALRFPYLDISRPAKEIFDLRVIIWDADEMRAGGEHSACLRLSVLRPLTLCAAVNGLFYTTPCPFWACAIDTIGDMNDLYFSAHLLLRDQNNRAKEISFESDTHWRAKDGKGNFNYRFLFQDLELPIESDGQEDDLPRFTLKAWDADIIGANDQIGSSSMSLQTLFERGWRNLKRQRDRDAAIAKMTVEQLRQEVSNILRKKKAAPAAKDSQKDGQATGEDTTDTADETDNDDINGSVAAVEVEKSTRKEHQKNDETQSLLVGTNDSSSDPVAQEALRVRLQQRLLELDPIRDISSASTRQPEKTDTDRELQIQSAKARMLLAKRKNLLARRGALSCFLETIGDVFCWVLQCKCLWGIMSYMKDTPARGAPYEWWDLKGPIPHDEGQDDEEATLLSAGTDEFGWGDVGRVSVSFELVPRALAELRPVGEGREEPNQFPFLHPPERETFSLLNPLGTLKTLVGSEIFAKVASLICCAACIFLSALMMPMLLSGVITSVIEKCCLPS